MTILLFILEIFIIIALSRLMFKHSLQAFAASIIFTIFSTIVGLATWPSPQAPDMLTVIVVGALTFLIYWGYFGLTKFLYAQSGLAPAVIWGIVGLFLASIAYGGIISVLIPLLHLK